MSQIASALSTPYDKSVMRVEGLTAQIRLIYFVWIDDYLSLSS